MKCAKKKLFINLVLIGLCSVLFVACGQKVSGVIYLDENGNKVYDQKERRLGNLMYKVYFNKTGITNELLDTGITELDGYYEFKAKEMGRYCVEVESIETQTPHISVLPPPTPAPKSEDLKMAGKGLKAVSSGDGEDDPDTDGDGVPDTEDNCIKVVNANQADADDDGFGDLCDPDPEDKKDDDEVVHQPATYDPGKSCGNLKEGQRSLTLDVGIAKEYKMHDNLSVPQMIEARAGETFTIRQPYPKSCIFQPMTLDPALQFGEVFIPGAGMSVINPSRIGDRYPASVSYGLTSDVFDEIILQLVSDPEQTEDEKVVDVKMTLICPDGNVVSLIPQVTIYRKDLIKVTASLESTPDDLKPTIESLGIAKMKTAKIKYVFENMGTKPHDIQFNISAGGLFVVEDEATVTYGDECSNLGTAASCSFTVSEPQVLVFKFKLPPDSAGESYLTVTSLKVTDVIPELPIEIDTVVEISVQDVECSQVKSCPGQHICNRESYECELVDCTDNSHCDTGFRCDVGDNVCIAIPETPAE